MAKMPAVVTPNADNTATMTGPITRDPLTIVELSEIAPWRLSLPTMAGSAALHAGHLRALPMPTASTTRATASLDGCAAARPASTNEKIELFGLTAHQERAAREPVGDDTADRREQQRSELAEDNEADNFADPWLSALAYTPSVTFCIHVPMLDANEPSQRMRKSRWARAERTVPGWWRGAVVAP